MFKKFTIYFTAVVLVAALFIYIAASTVYLAYIPTLLKENPLYIILGIVAFVAMQIIFKSIFKNKKNRTIKGSLLWKIKQNRMLRIFLSTFLWAIAVFGFITSVDRIYTRDWSSTHPLNLVGPLFIGLLAYFFQGDN